MPKSNKPSMILKTFRVPADLWQRVIDKAAERQENVSDVIRRALERYANKK